MNAEDELEEELSPEQRVRRRRQLLGVAALIVAILLAIFVPPLVSLGHYRRSITASIAGALGRPVAVGQISLRLLPRPGIALTDLTVEEDPAFGAEPALHAESVVVALRLSSLWRRRLEISRISLDQASLNLVRNAGGQWSIDTLLLRASQIPNAPTAQRHAGATPRFPYIEATNSRIDFRQGVEKKPFSLMNAEFAMWQAGGGQWQLRLKAQPVRTDLPLQLPDMGELNVAGSLQRAADLKSLPVNLTVAWRGAQLGQVSELLSGQDTGWRGSLELTGKIGGTPADLQLHTTMQIVNLRRQEFQPLQAMDVNATCAAEYQHEQRALNNITCFLPTAPGHLLLTGSVHGLAPAGADLRLDLDHVPAQFPVTMLGLMRSNVQNTTAAGDINGTFRVVTGEQAGTAGAGPSLSGDASVSGVSIANGGGTLALPDLHFVAGTPGARPETRGGRAKETAHAQAGATASPQSEQIFVEPVAIPFGETAPLTAEGSLTRSGFTVHVTGAASMEKLSAPSGTLGLLGHALAAAGRKGRANLDVTTSGAWLPPLGGTSHGLSTSGTVHLTGLQVQLGFLPAPVTVEAADVVLDPEQVAWRNAAIQYQGIALHGSVEFPAACDQPGTCAATFTLEAPALDGSVMSSSLRGRRRGFFGQMFANALGGAQRAPFPPLEGTIQAKVFTLDRLALHQVTAAVLVDSSGLTLKSLDAAALGGKLHATGAMALTNGTPNWTLDVQCTGLNPSAAAGIFHERWGMGQFSGTTKLTLSGQTTVELEASAAGEFHFTWQNGGMAGLAGPLGHFTAWTGSGTVVNEALTLTDGGLGHGVQATPVRGSVGFDRHIDLTVQARSGTVHVRGTLAHPSAH